MVRPLPLVVAALLVTPLPAAHAAKPKPKPVPPSCRLVVDNANDNYGFVNGQKFPTYDTGLDVIGADLATKGDKATAVFRFQKVNETDSLSPTGRYFELAYTAKGKAESRIWVIVSGRGNYSDGEATVDNDSNEIRVTVPLAKAGLAGLKQGTPVTKFKVVARRWAGAYPAGVSQMVGDAADEASGTATYPLHNKSCVTIGK